MRAAAIVRMVDDEGVAVCDRAGKFLQHGVGAGRERADVQRQHDVLGDDLAASVHQRAGGILRLAHDGGEAGAEQRVLHLLDDAGERGLDDFEIDRGDVHSGRPTNSAVMPGLDPPAGRSFVETPSVVGPSAGEGPGIHEAMPVAQTYRRILLRLNMDRRFKPGDDAECGALSEHHFSIVTIRFFHSSTRATWPGQSTVVQSNWSSTAGPRTVSPTSSLSR
jgi:hypothetical protein